MSTLRKRKVIKIRNLSFHLKELREKLRQMLVEEGNNKDQRRNK